jgi:hypothetical protein
MFCNEAGEGHQPNLRINIQGLGKQPAYDQGTEIFSMLTVLTDVESAPRVTEKMRTRMLIVIQNNFAVLHLRKKLAILSEITLNQDRILQLNIMNILKVSQIYKRYCQYCA